MAERRMFAKTIIDSDAFLDMPHSTQLLYFHLSMRADDEGFINNPKKIQRMIGCSEDDLKLLCAKNFIIPFETGVVVIKHWRIHNYIRADRMIETKYKDERDQLAIKENGAYTLCEIQAQIEDMDADDKRKVAYKNSSLPYSFTYKIRRAFSNRKCPVCGCTMNPAYKRSMPTIQHNVPISKGGVHELENISVICESCNTSIRDKETDELNNAEVIRVWDQIIAAEQNSIDWFANPKLLDDVDVGQLTVTCPSNDSIGKDSIGKDSLGKANNNIRFKPPTVEEVAAYCRERNNAVDAENFVDYYTANGWLVGKNKMRDWKAAVRTWEKNNYNKNSGGEVGANGVKLRPDDGKVHILDKIIEGQMRK